MPTMSRKNLLVGLAAAGVLGAGIAAPTLAFADNSTPTPAPSASAAADPSASARSDKANERESKLAEALAKELGLPTDQVQAALQKVREQFKPEGRPQRGDKGKDWGKTRADRAAAIKERLDQAVKDGKLTQEQADAIKAAIDAGVFPGGGWRGHGA